MSLLGLTVDPCVLVFRSKARFIPLADLASGSTDKVPAALNLPAGKLFFGWTHKPYEPDAPEASSSTATAAPPVRSGHPPPLAVFFAP